MDFVSKTIVYSMVEDIDDTDIHENQLFIAWLRMSMILMYVKTISVKKNEDGKMLIKRLIKGAFKLPQQY
jgi:hypothetical protein